MKKINCYRAKARIPARIPGYYIRLDNLMEKKLTQRRPILQSIVTNLNDAGFDCAVVTKDLLSKYDIAVLSIAGENLKELKSKLEKHAPKIVPIQNVPGGIVYLAWQNRVRIIVYLAWQNRVRLCFFT